MRVRGLPGVMISSTLNTYKVSRRPSMQQKPQDRKHGLMNSLPTLLQMATSGPTASRQAPMSSALP